MTKKLATLAGILGLTLAVGAAQAAAVTYHATLSGKSEVPPTSSNGTGSATVTVDPSTGMASWSVTYSGLSGPATAAHIHCGAAAGANGPVAVPFGNNPPNPITGQSTQPMTKAQLDDLQAGKCYVNIHTAANPGGEIRGQLMP